MGSRSGLALLAASLVVLLAPWPSCAAVGDNAPEGATERAAQLTAVTFRHANGRSSTHTLVPGELVPISHDRPMFYLYRGGTELRIQQEGGTFSVSVDGRPARLAGMRPGDPKATAASRRPLVEAGLEEPLAADEPNGMEALKKALAQRVTPLTITCDGATLKSLPPIPGGIDVALVVQADDLEGLAPFAARCPGLFALAVYAERWVPDAELFEKLRRLTTLDLQLHYPAGVRGVRLDDHVEEAPRQPLEDIRPLASLTSLRVLNLGGRVHPTDVQPLAELKHLVVLHLDHVGKRGDLAFLSGLPDLEKIHLGSCDAVTDLSPLTKAERLADLTLHGCNAVEDLSPLGELEHLTALALHGGEEAKLADLSPLARLRKLRKLWLHYGLRNVRDLRPLASLRSLRRLSLRGMAQVRDISPIGELTNLEGLDLGEAPNIRDVEPLGKLTNLKDLHLFSLEGVAQLTPLQRLGKLETLGLHNLPRLTDLAPVAGLTALRRLYVSRCARLGDLRPLTTLPNLAEVGLTECLALTDLSPLAKLPRLEQLSITRCVNATDLTPLRHFVKRGGKLSYDYSDRHEKVKRLREETEF